MVFPEMGQGFWPLVSMAAILGGTMRSPLTGIVFALELTHDWAMGLPLLVAVPMAHAFTVLALKRSILTEKVSRRGFHLSREYATDPLEILFVREVMRTDIVVLPSTLTRAQLLASLDGASMVRPLFYVVDDAERSGAAKVNLRGFGGGASAPKHVDVSKKLVGVVTRSHLEAWMFGHPPESARSLDAPVPEMLGEIARKPVIADADEPLSVTLSRMAQTGRTWLPVVAHADPTEIVGEINLEDTLKARARHLEEEGRKEGVLPLTTVLPTWLRNVASVPSVFRSRAGKPSDPSP
jgi:CBS domain-containing protein